MRYKSATPMQLIINSTGDDKKHVILQRKIIFVLYGFRLILVALFCCSTLLLQAQLCSGSLGDPVVNITFGSGGGNTGYTPTNGYTYTSSSCPNDGYYTITNSTSGCFGNNWHTVLHDHTGNGAFMLVNASYNPGDFFVTTVTDLCPNTTYEFAAWIMNVLVPRNGIKPNITFSIETPSGTVLQQYMTGDVPETSSPVWRQYGFFFSTPTNNAVIVLRMTNNAPGGSGNDIGLDDITFRPCGAGYITATNLGNTDTVDICEGNTSTYNLGGAVSPVYASPVFQWQLSTDSGTSWKDISGATTLNYQRKPTNAGKYWYRLSVSERSGAGISSCRISSNIITVNVHGSPLVNAGPDRILFAGDSVTLAASVTGENPVYLWDPPDHLSSAVVLNPNTSPPANINYNLLVTSAYGCAASDGVFVKVVGGIYVPNAFTPNQDGKNDNWRIPFLDPLLDAEVNVFNRYGQLVYHVRGQTVDWDGTFKGMPQEGGVYVYQINYKKHNDMMNIRGTVLLMR